MEKKTVTTSKIVVLGEGINDVGLMYDIARVGKTSLTVRFCLG